MSERNAASWSPGSARFGIIINITGDVYRRNPLCPSTHRITLFQPIFELPPSHRKCMPSESSTAVLRPCADGWFRNCFWAAHHGLAHLQPAQNTATATRIAALSLSSELGSTVRRKTPAAPAIKPAKSMMRNDHFAKAVRLRCAMIESRKSLSVSWYVISTTAFCQTGNQNSTFPRTPYPPCLRGEKAL